MSFQNCMIFLVLRSTKEDILKNVSVFACTVKYLCTEKNIIFQNICFRLSQEKESHKFETTWGWVKDDRFFIFGWTTLLKKLYI